MVKIRGTRFFVTPAADADLPEDRRREFEFLNPSVKTYERLTEQFTIPGEADKIDAPRLVGALLRGWKNVTTDDPAVLTKYSPSAVVDAGSAALLPGPAEVPYAAGVAVDFKDLLPANEYREVLDTVWTTLNPAASGN